MEHSDKFPLEFNEEVKIIAYCPFCEADLNPIKAKIVESNNDLHLVHFQCNKCQGYILALVLKTAGGLSSIGLITDLTYSDVFRLKDSKPIKADKVIDIYKFFKQKDAVKQIIEIKY